MIRIIGICNSVLSECVQTDTHFTLDKAKKLVRQCEGVQEHQVILKNGDFQTLKMLTDTMYTLERLPKNHHQDSIN